MMDNHKNKMLKDLDDLKPLKHSHGKTYAKHIRYRQKMDNPMAEFYQDKSTDLYNTAMREYPTKRSKEVAKRKK